MVNSAYLQKLTLLTRGLPSAGGIQQRLVEEVGDFAGPNAKIGKIDRFCALVDGLKHRGVGLFAILERRNGVALKEGKIGWSSHIR